MTEQLIGLCRLAGGVVVGFDAVLGEVRAGRAKFVLVASDASDRTRKQLHDKCNYYHVTIFDGTYTSARLAEILGKRSLCAAAAFTGKGPSEAVKDALGRERPAAGEVGERREDRKDDV